MYRRKLAVVTALVLATLLLPATSALAAPPDNDDFAGSVVIDALPFATTVDTSEATNDGTDLEAGALCVGPPATDAGVWYSITTDVDTNVGVTTDGTDYSAGILVFTGEPGALVLETCQPFSLVFLAEAGTTYHMMIIDDQGDGAGNGGTLVLAVLDVGAELCPGIFENDPGVADKNLVMGTDGDDLLIGTSGPDFIVGLDGNDHIVGLGGDDSLAGCDGNDTIDAGAGNDEVTGDDLGFFGDPFAEGGDDTINGGTGDDELLGGPGNDIVRGGAGNDAVIGHQGDDVVLGEAGDDFVAGGFGNDHVDGGNGNDFVSGGWGDDTVLGGNGDDIVNGAPPAFFDFDPEPEAVDRCSGGSGFNEIVNCEAVQRGAGGAG